MLASSGGNVDSHSLLSKLPGFVWQKYSPEKHLPGYQYLGLSTRLDIRLEDSLQPKPGEEPINKTDEIAFHQM